MGSGYVKHYIRTLEKTVRTEVKTQWEGSRVHVRRGLDQCINRIRRRIKSFLSGIATEQPDKLLQRVLEKNPKLREGSDNTFTAIGTAWLEGHSILERE